jgi:O-antigen/teichoic acid export membrane protein
MVVIVAFQMFTQYYLAMPYQQLLRADKKVYVFSFIQSIIITLNVISFAVLAGVFPSLHLLKIITGLIYIAQPIALSVYIKKHYKIDKKAEFDSALNESKWDGFVVNIAWIVHTSTDVAVLTILTDLITVSVYTVHNIVANGLRKVLLAISAAIVPSIGQLYARGDKELLRKKFDTFEFYYFILTAGVFTIASLLIIPFVKLYTGGIDDASYSQPVFAYILIIAEFIYCVREPYYGLAQAAGKFKDMRKHACIEAGLNLAISIILIKLIGLPGVAIGTLVGNTYRTTYHVIYLKKNILNRSPLLFFKKVIVFGVCSTLTFVTCINVFPIIDSSIKSFLVGAMLYTFVTGVYYLLGAGLFYRRELMGILKTNKNSSRNN